MEENKEEERKRKKELADKKQLVSGREAAGRQTVSVIVPFHNGKDYLKQCVESLLVQTYQELEILLIDDGSTDGGGSLAGELACRHSRVRVFHTTCQGVSAARNTGLEAATGAYITFVDVDDRPMEDMIAYLADLLESTGSDVAGCEFFSFSDPDFISKREDDRKRQESIDSESFSFSDPAFISKREDDRKDDWESTGNSSREVLTGKEFVGQGILAGDTRCWSKLYRKEAVGGTRFPEGMTIGEDMLFLLQLACKGLTFCRGSYQGYGYFLNEKGTMLQSFRDSYMDQIRCWEQALVIIERELPQLRAQAAAILLTGTMLVAGKLALLPSDSKEKRVKGSCTESGSGGETDGGRKKKRCLQMCRNIVKKYVFDHHVMGFLDRGYRIKLLFFLLFPEGYLWIYGRYKATVRRSAHLLC